jgi:hypothetical protein
MRTTLAIDDDILVAAKVIAHKERKSIGAVVSELARRSLHRPAAPAERNGITLPPAREGNSIVTLDIVNALREVSP